MNSRFHGADGTARDIEPANGQTFTLDELQAFVGGYIEVVGLRDGRYMVVNEDGHRLELRPNAYASLYARQVILGDVVVTTLAALEGEQ